MTNLVRSVILDMFIDELNVDLLIVYMLQKAHVESFAVCSLSWSKEIKLR